MSACPTLFIPLWENLAVDKHKNDYRVILPLTVLFAIFLEENTYYQSFDMLGEWNKFCWVGLRCLLLPGIKIGNPNKVWTSSIFCCTPMSLVWVLVSLGPALARRYVFNKRNFLKPQNMEPFCMECKSVQDSEAKGKNIAWLAKSDIG